MHTYLHACIHMYSSSKKATCTCIHTYMHAYTPHMHACARMHAGKRTIDWFIYIHAYMHTCIHVHAGKRTIDWFIYIHAYMHTCIHVHAGKRTIDWFFGPRGRQATREAPDQVCICPYTYAYT